MCLVIAPADTVTRLDACLAIWDAITPSEPASPEVVRARNAREPRRLYLLTTLDRVPVACGLAGPSQIEGRGFVSPWVLPEARRRGVGTALLRALCDHLHAAGFALATARVDGHAPASLAFARRFLGIEQITTWTQEANAGMRAVIELLGYRYREPVLDVRAPLPLAKAPIA